MYGIERIIDKIKKNKEKKRGNKNKGERNNFIGCRK